MNADKATSAIARLRELIAEAETGENLMLPELYDAVDDVLTELKILLAAMMPVLRDACATVVSRLREIYIHIQRVYLAQQLMGWMPDRCACWIADHWPERWLPTIDVERLTEGET